MYQTLNSISKKILPDWLYGRLINQWDKEGVKKYSENTSWLLLGKIFSLSVSFFMVAIIARYLGPENLGKLSYAQSFVAIFSMLASLGINQILLRDLVEHPEKENMILGTAFIIKILFGTITILLTVLTAYFLNTDSIVTFLILILSLSFIFEPFGITSSVFSAKVKSKYSVLPKILVTVIVPLLKLLIIYLGKGIIFFAAIIIFEIVLGALISLYFYVRVFKHSPLQWSASISYGKLLIASSLPMMFAGISGYLFARIDQIMIFQFIDSTAVGIYYSAVQITELLATFLPGMIIGSLIPALINAKKNSTIEYYRRLRQLLLFVTAISLIVIAILSLFGRFFINTLYGYQFIAALPVLYIYIWSSLLYILMVILQQHLINDNKTMVFLFLSASTAVINITLNFLFIPKFGIFGAAIATIISFICYLLLPLLIPSIRKDYKQLFISKHLVT